MVALRLTRSAHPAVRLRRLLVAAASAGTGFLLLGTLGYTMGHPASPGTSLLRLAWCTVPLAATIHFAVAVARTDPGTRPRPGLSAIGLGPARLMALSAATTALYCSLGSALALLFFVHLRGGLAGTPFGGAADFLAADQPLPLPAALTLLAVVPATASGAVAVALRPKGTGPSPAHGPVRGFGRFGAYRFAVARQTFGAYGRFGAQLRGEARTAAGTRAPHGAAPAPDHGAAAGPDAGTAPAPQKGGAPPALGHAGGAPSAAPGPPAGHGVCTDAPANLPWGVAVLAVGLAVETYASRAGVTPPAGRPGVLVGWTLAVLGLALAGPGLTHLCGLLLQSVRPGALRLLAGRVLMAEAGRIGRPLGIVCAVASAVYAMASLNDAGRLSLGPLTVLGVLLVAGCTLATLLTAAVEARQTRADTTAALLRLGAPAGMLRGVAAVRAGALLALFGPLTLAVAELAALPLTR
ncbi:hypothetical protein [Streptomyces sp. NPDC052701]|uniref:hypothetical protein n=1 Tax=Streptomyces sp. NPDC052701 TaxID=3155533 RepID=UPI003443049E